MLFIYSAVGVCVCGISIRVVKVNTLALIDAVRNMKRVVKLTRPVPLPQMVDILVEVWETDGLQ